jgi:hypothetical protein
MTDLNTLLVSIKMRMVDRREEMVVRMYVYVR